MVRSVRTLAIEVWRRAEGMGLVDANASQLDAADITRLLKRVRTDRTTVGVGSDLIWDFNITQN